MGSTVAGQGLDLYIGLRSILIASPSRRASHHVQRHLYPAGQRHDLRQLRRSRRARPAESPGRGGGERQPGQRAGPYRRGRSGPRRADPGGGKGRLRGARAEPRTGHRRHDLRQLRRPCRTRPAQGARRAQRLGEPGQRACPCRGARRSGTGGVDPGRRERRLPRHVERRRSTASGRRRTTPAPRTPDGHRRPVAGRPAGAADVRRAVRRTLDAAALDTVPARHTGAVRARRTLLRRRLEGGARRRRQHGPAGGHRHQRRLRPEPLPVVGDTGRADAAPVFRSLGGGDRPGITRQVPGKPRQAPDQRRHSGARSAAPGARHAAGRWP